MPNRKQQVKQKTRVDKVNARNGNGRLKSTELPICGGVKDVGNTDNRLSLHRLDNGFRLCQDAKIEDVSVLRFNKWKIKLAS